MALVGPDLAPEASDSNDGCVMECLDVRGGADSWQTIGPQDGAYAAAGGHGFGASRVRGRRVCDALGIMALLTWFVGWKPAPVPGRLTISNHAACAIFSVCAWVEAATGYF